MQHIYHKTLTRWTLNLVVLFLRHIFEPRINDGPALISMIKMEIVFTVDTRHWNHITKSDFFSGQAKN